MRNLLLAMIALPILFGVQGCMHDDASVSPKPPKHYRATKFTSAARHKATMKCYTVLGKTYRPTYVKIGQTMRGVASWYGPHFHGKYTSNGERYNMYAKTAAHKTWPMDTMVRVTNLENGRSTVVRINDRGPFVKGRIIDCSYAAGKALGLDKSGIAKVELKVIGFAGKVRVPSHKKGAKKSEEQRIRLRDFGIQVGAFRSKSGAERVRRRYAKMFADDRRYRVRITRTQQDGAPLYRVWLTGFDTEEAAKAFRSCRGIDGPIVRP